MKNYSSFFIHALLLLWKINIFPSFGCWSHAEIAGEIFTGGNFSRRRGIGKTTPMPGEGKLQCLFLNSLVYSACTLAGGCCFLNGRVRFCPDGFSGAKVLFYFFVVHDGADTRRVIPLYVLLIKLNLANTMTVSYCPTSTAARRRHLYSQGLFRGDPKEIQEAAKIDGCGVIRIYWTSISLWQDLRSRRSASLPRSMWERNHPRHGHRDPNLMPIQRGVLEFRGQH